MKIFSTQVLTPLQHSHRVCYSASITKNSAQGRFTKEYSVRDFNSTSGRDYEIPVDTEFSMEKSFSRNDEIDPLFMLSFKEPIKNDQGKKLKSIQLKLTQIQAHCEEI